ncbi:PQQ-dependent sugar dehydrogenase [Lacimicrobium alkaliphilum]|uniref:Glucose dehydrogenase n=1 Tax=Lacimicrobium alkaliphilum TaxID=1526571 RepID=A0A0U2Z8Z8_9ALTE|nr:PQQ-dependent sugar dehydrogenase [Lacimicrobium alkaliphilum]ALS99395.1 glucose dehydrogenase [Lacimicrobium alkaliphilum]
MSALKFLLLLVLLLPNFAVTGKTEVFSNYRIQTIATGLHYPWAVVELPDGSVLVTEKSGQLRRILDGEVSPPIQGVPEVYYKGQGGLMDIVLHPQYNATGWIYLTYAHGTDAANHLRLMRARLGDGRLVDQQVLFSAEPDKATPVHYGARLAFMDDNTLVLSSGDGFDYREQAQNPASHLGKLIRLSDDGSIPADNPEIEGAAEGVYSLGHRNAQGLAWDPFKKLLFANEHGPAGGDEINLIRAGGNYGWPVITYGKDYSGANISPFTEYPGMLQPLVDWTPSIAPSALVVYRGSMFAELDGDLLSATLKSKEVRRAILDGIQVSEQQSLFTELDVRLRDIAVATDGGIYLLTDEESGKLLKVVRAGN